MAIFVCTYFWTQFCVLIHVLSQAYYNLLLTLVNVSVCEKEIILSGSENKLVSLYTVSCVLEGGVSGTAPKQISSVTAPRQVHTYYLNTLQGEAVHFQAVSKANSNN